jgi:hypothetical protein
VTSADYALASGVVSERAPGSSNGDRQRAFGNVSPLPDFGKQLMLRNDSIRVRDQILDQIKNSPLERDDHSVTPQLVAGDIEFEVSESNNHGAGRVPEPTR